MRPLTVKDAAWMAALMADRRAEYEAYSPVFWRRAPGVGDLHTRFLQRIVDVPANIGLRTDRAFITALPRGDVFYADDFAVEAAATWGEDGRTLLLAAWAEAVRRGASALRVVTAQRDMPKVAMLQDAGVDIDERWWVKPLDDAVPGTAYAGRFGGDDQVYEGFLTKAPPVYEPGGPVFIVPRFDGATGIEEAEARARDLGAVVAILPIKAGAADDEEVAHRSGYDVASEFFEGRPA